MNTRQHIYRLAGRWCPPISSLEIRVCGHLQRWLPPVATGPGPAGNGFLMAGDTSNVAFLTGLHERAYLHLLGRLISPGDTVYDVGANAGYLILWLSRHAMTRGQALNFVAVEPEPATAAWLTENLQLNPDVRAEVVPIALGAASGTATLWSVGRGDGSVSADPTWVAREDRRPFNVRIERLDDFCATTNAPRPDWIVLDVEGFGHDVIAGASEVLAADAPGVAAEVHGDAERRGLERALGRAGYRCTHELQTAWGVHVVWQR